MHWFAPPDFFVTNVNWMMSLKQLNMLKTNSNSSLII